jgi:hypothetical protein
LDENKIILIFVKFNFEKKTNKHFIWIRKSFHLHRKLAPKDTAYLIVTIEVLRFFFLFLELNFFACHFFSLNLDLISIAFLETLTLIFLK